MNLENKLFPYAITVLGNDTLYLSGAKTVLLTTPNAIKVRLVSTIVEFLGTELSIVEIGGGDIYIKGRVTNVNFN
ncbi:MAG: YabP/YqfC family sporulation protein [Clostridia bacterium]